MTLSAYHQRHMELVWFIFKKTQIFKVMFLEHISIVWRNSIRVERIRCTSSPKQGVVLSLVLVCPSDTQYCLLRSSSFLLSFFTLSISYLYLVFHDMDTGPPIRPKHHLHWRGWRCVLQARRWHGARIQPAHQIWIPHPDGWQVKRSATCVIQLATVQIRSQMPILITGINCDPCWDK